MLLLFLHCEKKKPHLTLSWKEKTDTNKQRKKTSFNLIVKTENMYKQTTMTEIKSYI